MKKNIFLIFTLLFFTVQNANASDKIHVEALEEFSTII